MTTATISPWPLVRQGDQQHPVQTLQYLLRARGRTLTVDGIFGPGTDAAVRGFQQQQGLAVDGIFGPDTEAAVRGFQQALHLDIASVTVDGIVGPVTWQALVSGMLSF
jgi:peptidoglycan hydrolase-like protein with peptidoglycan-binding domain